MQQAASGGFMNALALAALSGTARAFPSVRRTRRWGKRFVLVSRRVASWSNCRRRTTRSAASKPTPSFIARCRWMKSWRYTMCREEPRRCEFGRH